MGTRRRERLTGDPSYFWSRVDIRGPEECWEWLGCRTKKGYGSTRFGGNVMAAHRVAYGLANGRVPINKHVCHKCDNPPCVNPDHLFIGTNGDNVADRVAKDRSRGLKVPDVKNIKARLRNRRRGDIAKIAVQYGVSYWTIHKIARGDNWGRINGEDESGSSGSDS